MNGIFDILQAMLPNQARTLTVSGTAWRCHLREMWGWSIAGRLHIRDRRGSPHV